MAKKREAEITFETLKVEGGIIGSEWLGKVALLQAPNQSSEEYRVPSGLQLRDEIVRYWRIASAKWAEFRTAQESATDGGYEACKKFIPSLLKEVFDFESLDKASEKTQLGEREFPIPFFALNKKIPIVLGEPKHKLEHLHERYRDVSRKRTCFGLLQEYLNACDDTVWGIVSNGIKLRIARDNHSLTRPAWIEADLEQMFEGELFDEFAVLWLVLHESRFGRMDTLPKECALEVWRDSSKEEGIRARDLLRQGVEEAIKLLGQGFLEHPANQTLRERFVSGELSGQDYFRQLLRLVYRFIFLLTIEERNMLHPASASRDAIKVYREGYSVSRLRDKSIRRTQHDSGFDAWESLQPVFDGLENGQALLGLPALGGLFSTAQCPDISHVKISNKALMGAIFQLSWMKDEASKSLVRINWKDMGPEEFGSVYESLLELVPEVSSGGRIFDLKTVAGNERKTTGSYYTPDSLVKLLLDSALEPVIKKTIDSNPADPVKALLQLTVIDPSCGSGHFLIAAAHRIASHVARLGVDGTPTSSDYAHALRQVITHCIFGTDLNPMALELAKMALWLEAHTPDTPLGFLDHHLVLGNALLGLVSPEDLKQGIPERAYAARTGDDKDLCNAVKAINRAEARSLQTLLGQPGQKTLGGMEFTLPTNLFDELEAMSDDTLEAIELKRQKLEELRQSHDSEGVALAMDLYMAAFLMRKTTGVSAEDIPTTRDVTLALRGEPVSERKALSAQNVCRSARVNHWPITFPQVFARGGFSCVLGNPPWERIKLQEQEFFASKSPEIANASNKAARDREIKKLEQADVGSWEYNLYQEFVAAKHEAESTSEFCHGPRYPLSGRGDVNTYALFSETIYQITNFTHGRAGFIVPTGIATDDSTKFYFAEISQNGKLVSLIDFENREAIFPGVHRSYKFSLLTLGNAPEAKFSFFLTNVSQVQDERRQFSLTPEEFALINPNTKTCPIFRSAFDAQLIKKIYRRFSCLLIEDEEIIKRKNIKNPNPWQIKIRQGLYHLTNDTRDGVIEDRKEEYKGFQIPIIEGKMIHQYNSCWTTYNSDWESIDLGSDYRNEDPRTKLSFRYFCEQNDLGKRYNSHGWSESWVLAWRDVTNSTNERTMIASLIPNIGISYTLRSLVSFHKDRQQALVFLALLNSLCCDYIVRQAIGGLHLSDYIVKQLALPSPDQIPLKISARLQLLVSYLLKDYSVTSGLVVNGLKEHIKTSPADLRAEIDAIIFSLYELNLHEVQFILDPLNVFNSSYPSITFPRLKANEINDYGSYQTQELILSKWRKYFDDNGNQVREFEDIE